MHEPTHLDLFSGIGGFALAAQWAGFRTIGFCEIDKYCRKVLAKNFPNSASGRPLESINGSERGEGMEQQEPARNCPPIYENIFDLNGADFAGVSLITGGFPCQPYSHAGQRRGSSDDRALWPQMRRVIEEARPAWIVGENVLGFVQMELDRCVSDLEDLGYATRAFVIPACAVDAKHRRDRVWIVGFSDSGGRKARESASATARHWSSIIAASCNAGQIPDTKQQGLEGQRQESCRIGTQLDDTSDYCRWQPEPDVGRVAHGVPSRVDRLKGLGNAIVPQVAYEILREIRKLI